MARHAPGGLVYHVLNRANGRLRLFKKADDYRAFEQVLAAAHERVPGVRILDWCLMPNHWHLVLWPERDGELTAFMRWLTLTHAQRWKHAHAAVGHGHLYQGRFKSFPVQDDHHVLSVCRYVQANPVRAKLVDRSEQWRWGSCQVRHARGRSHDRELHELRRLLGEWPVDRPARWLGLVNAPQPEPQRQRVAESIARGRPLGDDAWTRRAVASLGLEHTLRPRGRPVGWRKPEPLTDRKSRDR